ncbi:MAG: molybdate ABC transporter substrate-binding protein, partial [Pseudomonadota bacterium]
PARARTEDPVLVFAAASLSAALSRALDAALGAAARQGVTLVFGSSAALARQIVAGAPADLYVSAHPRWSDFLADSGSLDAASSTPLLGNALALAAAAHVEAPPVADDGLLREGAPTAAALLDALGRDGRLAIGRRDTTPLGLYGAAALRTLGLWSALSPRLAEAQDARAAARFVAQGAAPLGVLYASDFAPAAPLNGARVVGRFPAESHPQIIYPAALTQRGARRVAARQVMSALTSADAAATFHRHGFTPLASADAAPATAPRGDG